MAVDQKTTEAPFQDTTPEPEVKEEKVPAQEPPKSDLDEQIEVLEPVAKVVERKLKLNDEERTFVQHEMSFFTKLKFFRLASGTLRLATEDDTSGKGIADIIQEAMVGARQLGGNQSDIANVFLDAILRLVELTPNFMEETYLLALNIKPEESGWVLEALQDIDDEEALDILDVFVAQNGKAISDFFSKRLGKLQEESESVHPDAGRIRNYNLIETLEAFSAEHNISLDELIYEWPASKFEAFYSAYAKRKIADELAERRSLESAAIWGNMNYDSQEEPELRQNLQKHIQENYSRAIAALYGDVTAEEDEGSYNEDDPFWKAMEEGRKQYNIQEE